MSSYEEHLSWLELLPSPDLDPVLPSWMEDCIDRVALDPEKCIAEAEVRLEYWLERKRQLAPQWKKELATLAPHIQHLLGESKNVCLLREIATAIDTPDTKFTEHLTQGFPVCGDLDFSGLNAPKPRKVLKRSPDELIQFAQSELNQKTIDRVKRSKAKGEIAQAMLVKTMRDVESGISHECPPSAPTDAILLTPRFGNDEGWRLREVDGCEVWERKVRPCDDYLWSELNLSTSLGEAIVYEHVHYSILFVKKLRQADPNGKRGPIHLLSEDFTGAYNTLGLRSQDLRFCHATFKDADGSLREFVSHSCQFGAISSCLHWDRTGRFVQMTLSILFNCAVSRFVDDMLSSMYQAWAARFQRLIKRVVQDLLGWKLDSKKSEMGPSLIALGIRMSVRDDVLDLELPTDKREKWGSDLKEIVSSNRCSQATMGKCCGRLSWGSCTTLGRGARHYLRFMYSHGKYSSAVSKACKAALLFFIEVLERNVHTRIPLLRPPKVIRALLYTDAENLGGLGVVFQFGNIRKYICFQTTATTLTKVHYRGNQTCMWEALASAVGVWLLMELEEASEITELILATDNSTPLSLVRTGSSKQTDIHALGHNMLYGAALRNVNIVSVWVPSDANLADPASRFCVRYDESVEANLRVLEHLGFRRERFKPPQAMVEWF